MGDRALHFDLSTKANLSDYCFWLFPKIGWSEEDGLLSVNYPSILSRHEYEWEKPFANSPLHSCNALTEQQQWHDQAREEPR